MKIFIEDLKFQTIIGILDFERETPQDVIINLEIKYNYTDEFINYAEVASHIKESMIRQQFSLIEDALSTLSKSLKKEFQQILSLDLKITKPSILPDCIVSVSKISTFNT